MPNFSLAGYTAIESVRIELTYLQNILLNIQNTSLIDNLEIKYNFVNPLLPLMEKCEKYYEQVCFSLWEKYASGNDVDDNESIETLLLECNKLSRTIYHLQNGLITFLINEWNNLFKNLEVEVNINLLSNSYIRGQYYQSIFGKYMEEYEITKIPGYKLDEFHQLMLDNKKAMQILAMLQHILVVRDLPQALTCLINKKNDSLNNSNTKESVDNNLMKFYADLQQLAQTITETIQFLYSPDELQNFERSAMSNPNMIGEAQACLSGILFNFNRFKLQSSQIMCSSSFWQTPDIDVCFTKLTLPPSSPSYKMK